MSTEKWQVGQEVATLRSHWRNSAERPTFAKIERIGKRDIVLDDGQRFNVNSATRREGGDWGWTVALLRADDPVVAEAQARHDHARVVTRARSVVEDWRFGKGQATPADAILALAPLTGVEDEIRALFEPTPGGDA